MSNISFPNYNFKYGNNKKLSAHESDVMTILY